MKGHTGKCIFFGYGVNYIELPVAQRCNLEGPRIPFWGFILGLRIGLFWVSIGGHIGGVAERLKAGGLPWKAAILFTNRNTRIRIPDMEYTTNMSGVGMACPPVGVRVYVYTPLVNFPEIPEFLHFPMIAFCTQY